MASALRSSSVPARRVALQSFTPTAPKHPAALAGAARNLHITGAKEQSQFLAFESTVADLPKRSQIKPTPRHFNTSRVLKTNKDSSTIDFAYMPSISPVESDHISEFPREPLLPDNYYPERDASAVQAALGSAADPPVVQPQISVASLGAAIGTMQEVSDGGKAADAIGLVGGVLGEAGEAIAGTGEKGVVREVWSGFLDDLFGERKVVRRD